MRGAICVPGRSEEETQSALGELLAPDGPVAPSSARRGMSLVLGVEEIRQGERAFNGHWIVSFPGTAEAYERLIDKRRSGCSKCVERAGILFVCI